MVLKTRPWDGSDPTRPPDSSSGQLGPYSANHLADHGFELRVSEASFRAPWTWPAVRRVLSTAALKRADLAGVGPAIATPVELCRADATVGIFEDAGSFAGMLRSTPARALIPGPLLLVACWLGERAATGSPQAVRRYRRILSGCDAVVYFSRNQTEVFRDLLGVPAAKLHPISYGVDADYFRRDDGPPGDYLLAAGSDFARDHRLLVDAVGDTGIRTMIFDPRPGPSVLPPNVTWHREPISNREYRRLLHGARAVVIPSRPVQYPSGQTVLLEAMAARVPAIISDSPAIRDYVDPGRTALLVAPGDSAALRKALLQVMADDQLVDELAVAAVAVARSRFTQAHMWAQIAGVLHGLLGPDAPVDGRGSVRML